MKGISPFKMHKIIFFQKNMIAYPNQNFQTCYLKHNFFLFGLNNKLTRLVTVGSCLAFAMRCPSKVFVLSRRIRTEVALMKLFSVSA